MLAPEGMLERNFPEWAVALIRLAHNLPLVFVHARRTWGPIQMGTHADGIALEGRHSETTASKQYVRSVPQTGDVLASARTARADVYTISIVPETAHLRATRHAEALEKVRELARGLHVDGWFTCNHTHYARVASFRERSGQKTGRVQ